MSTLTAVEPTLAAVVPVRAETGVLLPRLLNSIEAGDFDAVWAVGHYGGLFLLRAVGSEPCRVEIVPASGGLQSVREVIARVQTDWVCLLHPSEFLPPVDHTAASQMRARYPQNAGLPRHLKAALRHLPADANYAALHIFAVFDSAGTDCRGEAAESRLMRVSALEASDVEASGFKPKGDPLNWGATPVINTRPILYQLPSAYLYEQGDYKRSFRLATDDGGLLNQNFLVRSRTKLDTKRAFEGFKALVEHAMLYEELGVAKDLLQHRLPYTIENEHAEGLKELRASLQRQIGHLLGPRGERGWYEDGAVAEVLDLHTALHGPPTLRVEWLVKEVQRRGPAHRHKRVVEFGALDGVSLFQALRLAPEIEWVGVECNPKSVAHGNKLAQEGGLGEVFDLRCSTFEDFTDSHAFEFDAAFCFEVLEHNFAPHDVLLAVEESVKPGGRVFLTTPNGAWSLHNPATYDLECRKEHVVAYTLERMRAVLKDRGATDIQIAVVENPVSWEANSWLFCSYLPHQED